MTRKSFGKWLEGYVRAQERGDAEAIKEVFTEDGVYWFGPYNEPRRGLQAIYEHHKNALARQSDHRFDYEILATTEEYGIAKFRLFLKRIDTGEKMEYEGIFLVHLDDSNRCTLFEEWVNSRIMDG
jgi:ketosteroid isomerase-like protein